MAGPSKGQALDAVLGMGTYFQAIGCEGGPASKCVSDGMKSLGWKDRDSVPNPRVDFAGVNEKAPEVKAPVPEPAFNPTVSPGMTPAFT